MKKLFVFLFLALSASLLYAQEVETKSVDLSKVDALITSVEEEFVMHSQTSGDYNVSESVMIFNSDGASAMSINIGTDPFRKLTSFSGKIIKNGKVIQKIKFSDLQMEALASGLADDIYYYSYSPSAPTPYTFEYDYSMSYKKGFSAFPPFFPIVSEKIALLSGTYTLSLPAGTQINYNSSVEPDKKGDGKRDVYSWKVSGFKGCKVESFMPNILDLVPYVLSSPVDFTYAGEKNGKQDSWKNLGVWLYNLQKPKMELSQEFKNELIKLTSNCKTELDKIEVLYNYLKDHTRYVSIQLGIGGYVPFPAQTVAKVGFGDCKGLSNFMRSMLLAVGIESIYYVIDTKKKNLIENYYSLGQMDHVMLAIPLTEGEKFKGDTIWMECTNPLYPLGYKHSDAAGHQVLMLKEDGGELVRISPYLDSLSRKIQLTDIKIYSDGSARFNSKKELYLDYMEPFLMFGTRGATEQNKILSSELKLIPQGMKVNSVTNNFAEYKTLGRDFCPLITVDYSFGSESFAKKTGERMFIPVTPFSGLVNYQRETRENDIKVETFGTVRNIITIEIPAGYQVESFPKNSDLDFDWASFSSKIVYNEAERRFVIVTCYISKPGEFPKEKYQEYIAFAKKVNRYFNSSIVLKKL